jgi:hypothetical protein
MLRRRQFMPRELSDRDWRILIPLIREGRCTPFLGAGACDGTLPLGSEVARQWAQEYAYPLPDKSDLARVAQFLAIDQYEMFPKDLIRRRFEEIPPPDFGQDDEPHALLADLNLPLYITTNYDQFMFAALQDRGRDPRTDFCRWNQFPEAVGEHSVLDSGYQPTRANPLVYHLHGHIGLPQSMVLTESDYLDFLIRLSRDQDLLPAVVRRALAGTALLFIGYSLRDWSFRVVLRGLVSSLGASVGYTSIAVQLPPQDATEEEVRRTQEYLDQYFDEIQRIKVRLYWGDCRDFCRELRQHWEA